MTILTSASIEMSELLIAWGAEVRGKSALIIASHHGRADLVRLLPKNVAEANGMGVANVDDDPEDLERKLLCAVSKKERLEIL